VISCLFASDLHAEVGKYRKLLDVIDAERPAGVFLGGDLLPEGYPPWHKADPALGEFFWEFLVPQLEALRARLGPQYPETFVIPGNEDRQSEEWFFLEAENRGLWHCVHRARRAIQGFSVFGYAYVPPTPFALKDWERYDVAREVRPGCVSPELGWRTVDIAAEELRDRTIAQDLDELAGDADLSRAILLFHVPPRNTNLDRASPEWAPRGDEAWDPHVGSIAVRRLIETRQPLLGLHGHVHESARQSGTWRDRIGRSHLFSAAHGGEELALVRFDLENLEEASRELL